MAIDTGQLTARGAIVTNAQVVLPGAVQGPGVVTSQGLHTCTIRVRKGMVIWSSHWSEIQMPIISYPVQFEWAAYSAVPQPSAVLIHTKMRFLSVY